MGVLDEIVKAYDVRGTVPDQFNADVARALGVGFARYAGARRAARRPRHAPTGPELVEAFTDGVRSQGVDVVDIGLASTDMVYFAAGKLDAPGRDVHRLAQPGRVQRREVLPRRRPPGRADTGLGEIKARRRARCSTGTGRADAPRPGRTRAGPAAAFVDHVLSFVDAAAIRPMRVVADTANGMGGLVVPAVFERIPPIDARGDVRRARRHVPQPPGRSVAAGQPARPAGPGAWPAGSTSGWPSTATPTGCSSSTRPAAGLSGLHHHGVARRRRCCARNPGATMLHNLICSRAVPEVIREHGGVPVRTKVGHSFIKQLMAETGAVFGGEHSAHYYFATTSAPTAA